jgi:ankyrin repeat protein
MALSKPAGHIVKVYVRLSRSLVESGVDLDPAAMEQCGGATALLESLVASASAFGLDDDTLFILEYLLQKGAGISPEVLALGVQPTGVRLLETLAQYGAGIEKDGRYALMAAACEGNYEAVDWLLQQRVNINSEIGDPPVTLIGTTTLKHRGEFEIRLTSWSAISLEMTQYLLDKGADMKLHPSDTSPYNFIMDGVDEHHVIALISQNPSEMAKMSDLDWLSLCNWLLITFRQDDTLQVLETLKSQHRIFDPGALLAAAIWGTASYDLIEGLLETASSIEIYSCGFPRLTPLQAAASNCDQSLILRLLDRGANIHAPAHEDRGETVLTALFTKNLLSTEKIRQRNDLLPLLIARGADITAAGPHGWGPLHACASSGDLNNTLLLLEHGADPTLIGTRISPMTWSSASFFTALDSAVFRRRLDITHVLLKAGGLSARPGSSGYEGALMLAESEKLFAIAQVIRDHVVAMAEELDSRPDLLRQHEERMQQQISRCAEAENRWEEAVRRWQDQISASNRHDEDLTCDAGDTEGIEDGDGGEPEDGDGDDVSESREVEAGNEWDQPYSAPSASNGHEKDGPYQDETVPDYWPAIS